MDTAKLLQPLPKSAIKHRKQGQVKLSYIEGYHAINMANDIFGFGEWSKDIIELKLVHQEERQIRDKTRYDVHYLCRARVNVFRESEGDFASDASFEDVGYGNGSSYQGFGEAHELAAKEAVTDAMKRCLRHFGDQFGNCLYDKDFTPTEEPVSKPSKAPSAPSKPSKAEEEPTTAKAAKSLPKMTPEQRQRMGRIWKFINENLNKDGKIKPEDVSCAVYAMFGGWPNSAADEEHAINNIGIERE